MILTTAGMPQRDAFEYWHDVVCAKIAKNVTVPLDGQEFYAEYQRGALADIQIFDTKLTPISMLSVEGDDLLLCLNLSSSLVLQYPDREVVSQRGTLCLADSREAPARHLLGPLHHSISLFLPRMPLAQRIPITKEHSKGPISIEGGAAALLIGTMRTLVAIGPSTLSAAARILECEHVLDLVALVLGNLSGETPELASPNQLAILKIRQAIETQLTDLAADRASIAAAAGVSERHANRLLAREGTSITELFRKRRLAKCREALEQSNRSINDIAHEFGWAFASNFARDFRREFGFTPREARYLIHEK